MPAREWANRTVLRFEVIVNFILFSLLFHMIMFTGNCKNRNALVVIFLSKEVDIWSIIRVV